MKKLSGRRNDKESSRPILWLGGRGLPGGSLGRELARLGHPLRWDRAGRNALPKLRQLDPALVLLEVNRMHGPLRKTLAELESALETQAFLLFLIVSKDESRPNTLADGCLVKQPGLALQIKKVLRSASRWQAVQVERLRMLRAARKLKKENRRLRGLVTRDDLTSLYNLRFFNRCLETEHARATRFGRQYSILFLDVDGLRKVNSRFGHLAGGRVLKRLGEYLSRKVRRIDIAARIGGDEFVVICPETSKITARVLAERIRQDIEELPQEEKGHRLHITASLGVASFPEDGDSPPQILERADKAVYVAKKAGRNRVCCWGDFPS